MKMAPTVLLLLAALSLLATVPTTVSAAKPVATPKPVKPDVDKHDDDSCPTNYMKKESLPTSCVCAAVAKCGSLTGPAGGATTLKNTAALC
jgi:hypothetical protein